MNSAKTMMAVLLGLGMTGSAIAQTTTTTTQAPTTTPPEKVQGLAPISAQNPALPSNNAVSTSSENMAGAPFAGANSFTQGEASARIADRGFTQITDLKLDDRGIWRGTAMKDGKSVPVALDYQGNVVAQ